MDKPRMQYLYDISLREFVRYAEDTVLEKIDEESRKCMENGEMNLENEKLLSESFRENQGNGIFSNFWFVLYHEKLVNMCLLWEL